jgi:hypothetical protein
MHNNTHSVHKRLLVMWRARLLCFEPFHYVYPPPLSEANCLPFPPPGGPGPPASKMAPFPPGSTHTPPYRPLHILLPVPIVSASSILSTAVVEGGLWMGGVRIHVHTSDYLCWILQHGKVPSTGGTRATAWWTSWMSIQDNRRELQL